MLIKKNENSLLNNLVYEYTTMQSDLQKLSDTYYQRDCEMNLDPKKQIYQSLQKLRYINIDPVVEENNFKLFLLKKKLKDFNELLQYKEDIENSNELEKFRKKLKQRGEYLSKFLESPNLINDNKGFYNSLTFEELEYIGY